MKKHVLFIQGAGEGAYKEDKMLVASLQKTLGSDYEVHYPAMPDEDNAPYDQWKQLIEKELTRLKEPIFLVGHSMGGSYIAKFLSEVKVENISGVFLISTPFWGGDGWLYEGYEELVLAKNFASKDTKKFLYHCKDDEMVPFEHLALYARILPNVTVREIEKGGHQCNNDLSLVAEDIKSL